MSTFNFDEMALNDDAENGDFNFGDSNFGDSTTVKAGRDSGHSFFQDLMTSPSPVHGNAKLAT